MFHFWQIYSVSRLHLYKNPKISPQARGGGPRRRRRRRVAGAGGGAACEGRQAGLGGRGGAELPAERRGAGRGAADVEGGGAQRRRRAAGGAQGVAGRVGRLLVLLRVDGGAAVRGERADLGRGAPVTLKVTEMESWLYLMFVACDEAA